MKAKGHRSVECIGIDLGTVSLSQRKPKTEKSSIYFQVRIPVIVTDDSGLVTGHSGRA